MGKAQALLEVGQGVVWGAYVGIQIRILHLEVDQGRTGVCIHPSEPSLLGCNIHPKVRHSH